MNSKWIVVASVLLIVAGTQAQWAIDRYVIGGGGGHAVAAEWELVSVIGQPQARARTYPSDPNSPIFPRLTTGFWMYPAPPPPPPCLGDADGDRDVDLSDLAIVLANFGRSGLGVPGDIDRNGVVQLSDLAVVLGRFGNTCPE